MKRITKIFSALSLLVGLLMGIAALVAYSAFSFYWISYGWKHPEFPYGLFAIFAFVMYGMVGWLLASMGRDGLSKNA